MAIVFYGNDFMHKHVGWWWSGGGKGTECSRMQTTKEHTGECMQRLDHTKASHSILLREIKGYQCELCLSSYNTSACFFDRCQLCYKGYSGLWKTSPSPFQMRK
ncbi:hypothetical protein DITRI_Ditri05aG0118300 [Diplodiscus trichospermus]